MVLSRGLEEHPKLSLRAVPPSSGLCKSNGKEKKNQHKRAGKLEHQPRETEVSLATGGTEGTKSS